MVLIYESFLFLFYLLMELKFVFRNLNQLEFDAMSADEFAIDDMLDSGLITPSVYFRLRSFLFRYWFPQDYIKHH